MANTHKAHKNNKKYSFQRNPGKTRNWLIAIAAIIVAGVIVLVVYNNSLTGDIEVTAPAEASLNNIADNWSILASHTDKFVNYYSSSEDGTNGTGGTMLMYAGSEAADLVYVYIQPTQFFEDVANDGVYARPSIFTVDLGQLFAGETSLSDTTVALQAGNENCFIYLEDYSAEKLDDSAMAAVIAELEAVIAEGPVVPEVTGEATEEATGETAEETPATTEETPAE